MDNLALHRPIAEPVTRAEALTDGIVSGYTGQDGFATFPWPGYVTIDLGEPQSLKCIRVLLWDGLGAGRGARDARRYKYRLLCSADRHDWSVLFETGDDGYNGWQVFILREPILTQYVRLHGLHNTANNNFQVVEIEAYSQVPAPVDATVECEVGPERVVTENGDGLPLEQNVNAIVNSLERLLVQHASVLNPAPFRSLISQLRLQVGDISALERRMGAIRRQLVEPVANEMERGSRYSVWGYRLGAAGLIATLISLGFYFWDKVAGR